MKIILSKADFLFSRRDEYMMSRIYYYLCRTHPEFSEQLDEMEDSFREIKRKHLLLSQRIMSLPNYYILPISFEFNEELSELLGKMLDEQDEFQEKISKLVEEARCHADLEALFPILRPF